jgi:hypothetical protein
LLALVLSGVVISLSGQVAVQTLRIDRSVERQIVSRIRTHHVGEAIAADVAAAFENGVHLAIDPNGRPQIHVHCLATRQTDTPYMTRLPARVSYGLVRVDQERLQLRRTVTLVPEDSGPTIETMIARDLVAFTVRVWQDQRWQPLEARLVPKLRAIKAFRIEWVVGDSKQYSRTLSVGQALTNWGSHSE